MFNPKRKAISSYTSVCLSAIYLLWSEQQEINANSNSFQQFLYSKNITKNPTLAEDVTNLVNKCNQHTVINPFGLSNEILDHIQSASPNYVKNAAIDKLAQLLEHKPVSPLSRKNYNKENKAIVELLKLILLFFKAEDIITLFKVSKDNTERADIFSNLAPTLQNACPGGNITQYCFNELKFILVQTSEIIGELDTFHRLSFNKDFRLVYTFFNESQNTSELLKNMCFPFILPNVKPNEMVPATSQGHQQLSQSLSINVGPQISLKKPAWRFYMGQNKLHNFSLIIKELTQDQLRNAEPVKLIKILSQTAYHLAWLNYKNSDSDFNILDKFSTQLSTVLENLKGLLIFANLTLIFDKAFMNKVNNWLIEANKLPINTSKKEELLKDLSRILNFLSDISPKLSISY